MAAKVRCCSAAVVTVIVLMSCWAPGCADISHHLLAGDDTWLEVDLTDNLTVSDKIVVTGTVNANKLVVLAAKFTPTLKIQDVKVGFRGNIGKPSPSLEQPLVVSIRNTAGGHTFTVPYPLYSRNGTVVRAEDHATQFMCPGPLGAQDVLIVGVSAGFNNSKNPAEGYHFLVTLVPVTDNWALKVGEVARKLEAQVPDPAVFVFDWPPKPSGVDAVTLSLFSVKANQRSICVTVAIQQRTCPLVVSRSERAPDAKYLTVSASAHLTLTRPEFKQGFYVVVMPHETDVACDPAAPPSDPLSRAKTVAVRVFRQETQYSHLAAPVLLTVLLIGIGFLATRLMQHDIQTPRLNIPPPGEEGDQEQRRDSLADSEEPIMNMKQPESVAQPGDMKPIQLSQTTLLVSLALLLLALAGYNVLTDLMTETSTGDLDICYRNDLCSAVVGGVAGVNHVLASLPYLGAGLGLLIAVYAQRRVYNTATNGGTVRVGVQHDFSLLHAAALALLVQAVASAVYGLCASPRTGRLDMVMVYFTETTLAVKLFQTRRGITCLGHHTPLLFTATLVLAGYCKQLAGNAWYVWLLLGLLQLSVCLLAATQLYVIGQVSLSPAALKQVWHRSSLVTESPNHKMNRAAFILVLLLNLSLVVAAIASRSTDFSSYVQLVLALHALLYLLYYLLLKRYGHDEQPGRPAVLLLAAGWALMLAATVLLLAGQTYDTEVTAASSRQLARPCLLHGLFDLQDVWHQLTAVGLLLTAIGVLLLDDDLILTPRMEIARI